MPDMTPSAAPREQDEPARVQPSSDDDGTLARHAQLGLRLLGLFLVAHGVAGLVGSLADIAAQAASPWRDEWGPWLHPHAIASFAASLVDLVIGMYFVLGGRWVLQRVFLSPSHSWELEPRDPSPSELASHAAPRDLDS